MCVSRNSQSALATPATHLPPQAMHNDKSFLLSPSLA
jgi:hypothetical protein